MMIIECVRFFGLRLFLMNFWILWLCLLMRVIMVIFVFVFCVIIDSSEDLLMLELVKRLICCL